MSAREYPDTPRLKEPALDVESWSESIHDGTDDFTDIREIIKKEGALRIAENYIESKLTLHLHFRVRPIRDDADTRELCAVVASDKGSVFHIADLSYVPDNSGEPRELARGRTSAISIEDLYMESGGIDAPNMKKPMLVYVVKPGKERQVRLSGLVSKLIGLDTLDKCPIIRAYTASRTQKPLLIPLPAYVDGELRRTGRATPAEQNKLPDEIVKRGPQVVAELPDDEPETGIGEIASEAEDVLTGIAVELADDAAIFLVKEGATFAVERGQVLVRSFKAPIDRF
jgi:hypothetical protein